MEKEEMGVTERESIALIASMINKAKNRYNENGFLYLLWGWVVLVCCVTQFIIEVLFQSDKGYFVWLATWLVLVYQIIYLKKRKRSNQVRTYADEITGYIWIVFVVVMIVGVFICIQFNEPQMVNSLILLFYGIPIFLSGGLLQFRALILGGIFCWVLAIISPFVFSDYGLLLIAAAIIGAWIIPGYLLKAKFKKQN